MTEKRATSMIDLISDTVTRPTDGMLKAMFAAEVGDDVFRADPTVNRLEARVAELFGKPAALYCPSGTMTNQIAIKTHTQPMDELICARTSHVFTSENGGYAYNSGVAIDPIPDQNGKITAEQIEACIKAPYDWLPNSRLVVIENSCNIGGGSYYTIDEIQPIHDLCRARGLALHLDGARLFNVLVETGESAAQYGALFDSISICLSKGLGAPVGSLLIGEEHFIQRARKYRKAMGGGMRQAGYLAAAGLYALEHHRARLKTDNERAKQLGRTLQTMPFVEKVRPVQTNIVIFDLQPGLGGEAFLEYLRANHINAAAFGPATVRFVTHLEITDEMITEVIRVLRAFKPSQTANSTQ